MSKKILGSIGIVVGLAVAVLVAYHFLSPHGLFKTHTPSPPAQPQAAAHQPTPDTNQKAETPATQPPAPAATPAEPKPSAPGPAVPPAVAPGPTPEPPSAEKKVAPLPTLEPKKEHGLVVGKFRRYKDAQRLLDKIKKKNLPGFIRKEGKYYKVWVGPFATPQEAEHARKKLRAALKISPQKREFEMPVPK
jgi:cell division septation protein DedD